MPPPLPTHPKMTCMGEKLTYYLLSYFLLVYNTYYPQNPGWWPLVAPLRGARFRAFGPILFVITIIILGFVPWRASGQNCPKTCPGPRRPIVPDRPAVGPPLDRRWTAISPDRTGLTRPIFSSTLTHETNFLTISRRRYWSILVGSWSFMMLFVSFWCFSLLASFRDRHHHSRFWCVDRAGCSQKFESKFEF